MAMPAALEEICHPAIMNPALPPTAYSRQVFMRALLVADPRRGPGYAIIEIHGVAPADAPSFLLQRQSDGLYLSGGGWRSDAVTLHADFSACSEDGLRLGVGPAVVDELAADQEYTLSLPGSGACGLALGTLRQSRIIGGQGVGLTPPPFSSERPLPDMAGSETGIADTVASPDAVTEGAEPTPDIVGDSDDAGLPSGVAAMPEETARVPRRRRTGCALLGSLLFAGWVAGGWALWHGAMSASPSDAATTGASAEAGADDSQESSFSLFPRVDPDGEPTWEEDEKNRQH